MSMWQRGIPKHEAELIYTQQNHLHQLLKAEWIRYTTQPCISIDKRNDCMVSRERETGLIKKEKAVCRKYFSQLIEMSGLNTHCAVLDLQEGFGPRQATSRETDELVLVL